MATSPAAMTAAMSTRSSAARAGRSACRRSANESVAIETPTASSTEQAIISGL